jgi:cytochrome b-561 domain containing protein 2
MVVYTWVLVFSNNPSALKYFAVHPPFQTLALGLFTAGILTLQPTSMAQPRAKARGFQRHQIIMLGVAFPILLVGSLAIIYNKYVNESPHFASWHGVSLPPQEPQPFFNVYKL